MTEPVDPSDADLARTIRQGRLVFRVAIGFLVLAIAVLAAGLIDLLYSAGGERTRTNNIVRHTTDSMCGFFGSLGTAPLPAASSEFGATIVIDSRNIYVSLRCEPALPPPDQTVVDLAAKYHLKLMQP